jgi:hypothetical protein
MMMLSGRKMIGEIINDNSVCIPLFGKEGLGEIF